MEFGIQDDNLIRNPRKWNPESKMITEPGIQGNGSPESKRKLESGIQGNGIEV